MLRQWVNAVRELECLGLGGGELEVHERVQLPRGRVGHRCYPRVLSADPGKGPEEQQEPQVPRRGHLVPEPATVDVAAG